MIKSVENFIIENNLTGKTILVGFSGGIDSSCLLDILSKIKNIKLIAIHLNHNWRGTESKRDEKFAREFAKKRGIEFYSETLSGDIKKTETDAREARYSFFKKCKEKYKADAVFLAHNKNDNIETLIYRLIKGTGPKGLNSIPTVRDFYFRPLINFERREIEKYLKENNVESIIDSSNLNTKYKRNLIREDLLPKMAEINPLVIEAISNFINVNKMNQEIVDESVKAAESIIKKQDKYNRNKFLSLSKPLKYEIVNRYLQNILKNRDFKTIKKIVDFIEENSSSQMSINKDLFLKVYDNEFYLVSYEEKKDITKILKEGENRFLGYKITVKKSNMPAVFPKNEENIQYTKLDFNNSYTIRTRREGDLIQPFGQKTIQKLKTFFIKKKVPLELRDKLPLISLGDEILFVPNIMTSEKLKLEKNDKNCYKIIIEKEI